MVGFVLDQDTEFISKSSAGGPCTTEKEARQTEKGARPLNNGGC